jgi:hypothetical protein
VSILTFSITAGLPEAIALISALSEGAAFQVLGGADGGVTAHDLLGEAGLGFVCLPHIGVEGTFGDVAVKFDFRVRVALAQNAA